MLAILLENTLGIIDLESWSASFHWSDLSGISTLHGCNTGWHLFLWFLVELVVGFKCRFQIFHATRTHTSTGDFLGLFQTFDIVWRLLLFLDLINVTVPIRGSLEYFGISVVSFLRSVKQMKEVWLGRMVL